MIANEESRKERTYYRQDAIVFLKTKEAFGGLSNMASGYPLFVNGIYIRTSEALYQVCRFPHLPSVQQLIIEQTSPMTAKMKSKPYRNQSREDWASMRIRIMRWCLHVKLAQHPQKFGNLLLSTNDQPIVEESRRDSFWGAKPISPETLSGLNVLGRLLMELREELQTVGVERLIRVDPPKVSGFLFLDRPIGTITGKDTLSMPRRRPLLLLRGKGQLTLQDQVKKREG